LRRKRGESTRENAKPRPPTKTGYVAALGRKFQREGASERANEREREGRQKTDEEVRGSRDVSRFWINEARSVMAEQSYPDRSGFRTPRGRASLDRAGFGPTAARSEIIKDVPHPLNIN